MLSLIFFCFYHTKSDLTMQEKYRWGILGPGKIAHQFAKGLSVTDKGTLYAVGSRDLARAEDFARQYGAPLSYGSYEELIHDNDVDVIYIATPHHRHYELSKKCLEAGKAVLCEKPITINTRQLEELVAIARNRKVFYMDALWTRFMPTILKTMEYIEKGVIGEVKSLKADFGFKTDFQPEGRLFNSEMGGGSILDIGIYPVFLSLLVLGYPETIKAVSVIGRTGVDESCSMAFSYKNGAVANLLSTFLTDTDTSAEISGTEGSIHINRKWFKPSSLTVVANGRKSEEISFETRMNGYEYEAEEVMRCLDEGRTESGLLPLDFSLQLMQLLDTVRREAGVFYREDRMF